MASQIAAGLDGIERRLDPGAFHEEPYDVDRPAVPGSLHRRACSALQADTLYRERFGSAVRRLHAAC